MGRLLALLSVLYFSIPMGRTLTGYCPSADRNLCISENLASLPAWAQNWTHDRKHTDLEAEALPTAPSSLFLHLAQWETGLFTFQWGQLWPLEGLNSHVWNKVTFPAVYTAKCFLLWRTHPILARWCHGCRMRGAIYQQKRKTFQRHFTLMYVLRTK